MVFWNEIDLSQIEMVNTTRDRTVFRYKGGPLRFQIPRGACPFGVSEYKSLNVDVTHQDFIEWWRQLEAHLCPGATSGDPLVPPFNSNLKNGSLRLKIDDAAYIFDQNSKQITPEIREGVFRGQDLACLIDVLSTYFFNGSYGLVVRVYQAKTLTDAPPDTPAEVPEESFSLPKGTCAFLSVE